MRVPFSSRKQTEEILGVDKHSLEITEDGINNYTAHVFRKNESDGMYVSVTDTHGVGRSRSAAVGSLILQVEKDISSKRQLLDRLHELRHKYIMADMCRNPIQPELESADEQ